MNIPSKKKKKKKDSRKLSFAQSYTQNAALRQCRCTVAIEQPDNFNSAPTVTGNNLYQSLFDNFSLFDDLARLCPRCAMLSCPDTNSSVALNQTDNTSGLLFWTSHRQKSTPNRRGLKLQGICFSLSVRRCHVFVTSDVSERRASAMTNNRATE